MENGQTKQDGLLNRCVDHPPAALCVVAVRGWLLVIILRYLRWFWDSWHHRGADTMTALECSVPMLAAVKFLFCWGRSVLRLMLSNSCSCESMGVTIGVHLGIMFRSRSNVVALRWSELTMHATDQVAGVQRPLNPSNCSESPLGSSKEHQSSLCQHSTASAIKFSQGWCGWRRCCTAKSE